MDKNTPARFSPTKNKYCPNCGSTRLLYEVDKVHCIACDKWSGKSSELATTKEIRKTKLKQLNRYDFMMKNSSCIILYE